MHGMLRAIEVFIDSRRYSYRMYESDLAEESHTRKDEETGDRFRRLVKEDRRSFDLDGMI